MAEPAHIDTPVPQSGPDTLEHHHHHLPDRRILTYIGVLCTMFLAALDQTVVGTALPHIVGELRGFDRYSWVATSYLLCSTAIIPVIGKISEQLGRKRVFMSGVVFFLLASFICGASQNMDQLIIFRGLQGIGAGVIMGSAFAIIADLFSPAERGKYTGLMTGVFGIASVIGPLLGGWLTDNLSWRWVFYVNVPTGAAVIVLLFLTFPAMRNLGRRPVIDYLGAVLVAGGAALLTLGASLAGTSGWSDTRVIVFLAAGAVLLVLVPFYEVRQKEAVLPPQMFKSDIFSVSMVVAFLLGIAMFGIIIYIPLFLQGVVGVKATNSGLLLTPLMLGMVTASAIGGFVLSATGRYKLQAVGGFVVMTVGLFLMTLFDVNTTQLQVSAVMVIFGLGLGASMPVLNVISQNAVEQRFMSPATSSLQFVRQIGATLGLAVTGSVLTQQLSQHTTANLPRSTFANVPPQFRDKVAGLTNPNALFGGAPQQLLNQIHDPARRAAFAQLIAVIKHAVRLSLAESLHTVFFYGLAVAAVAVVISLLLREIPLRRYSYGSETARPGRAEESLSLRPDLP